MSNVVPVSYKPGKAISAATTNATVIKSSAGLLGQIALGNINSAARYLKLYDKATSPTVGTDVPVQTYLIPGNLNGAGSNVTIANGLIFNNGIAFAITANMADSDTTAVGAGDVVFNYGYS